MNCEVRHLGDNIRYRILLINGEFYILDMERSFWKTIFPFFVWILPSTVFKLENSSILDSLNDMNKEKVGSSWAISLGGIGYFLGILLAPLMGYFEIPMLLSVNVTLLVIALVFVAILHLSLSQRRKKKLKFFVNLDKLPRHKLWINPNSTKQVLKLVALFLMFVSLNVLFFATYIETSNIMMLFISSLFFFFYLLTPRITVEEGYTTVKFKNRKHAN